MTQSASWAQRYPETTRGSVVDIRHGADVPDPYRYLEDPDDPRTIAFVHQQNLLSRDYLAGLPARDFFTASVTKLLSQPRYEPPRVRAGRYFRVGNPGGRNQDILYMANDLSQLVDAPDVLFDPNGIAPDGSQSLTSYEPSRDASLLAYSVSYAGSDWQTIYFCEIDTGLELPDLLRWCKWIAPVWLPDGESVLYWSYPAPISTVDGHTAASAGRGRLMQHRLGTNQDDDELIWSGPDDRDWLVTPAISGDGRHLILIAGVGTDPHTTVATHRLQLDDHGRTVIDRTSIEVIGDLTDAYSYVHCDGNSLVLRTDHDAPRGRVIAIDLRDVTATPRELVPQHRSHVVAQAHVASGALIVVWTAGTDQHIELYPRDGQHPIRLDTPDHIAIATVHGDPESSHVFASMSTFVSPPRTYHLDLSEPRAVMKPLKYDSWNDSREVATMSSTAISRDGTAVPLTIIRPIADSVAQPQPTLLYGYGGFGISVLPEYRVPFAAWVQAGGTVAIAHLRGGGEFGQQWHESGTRLRKQNVFDDAVACTESLIANGITTPAQLAIFGRSNGGLLVGALMTQRPELFAAALPTVGVLDMLRFDQFTIGAAWISDYGDPGDAAEFAALYAYSPLHSLRSGRRYPPTLVCTGSHDDRVVPAHSLKFAAQLQYCQAVDGGPVLLRVDNKAGHGSGKAVAAQITEYADQLAFIAVHTALDPAADPAAAER